MMTLVARLRDAQEALSSLARRHRVPGATLAIAKDDELLDFATGVVNADTGVETTTDSIFQIGSNTKVITATMVMQLVDSGMVDLDAPVKRYLKGFTLEDRSAASEITVRQLLTHTSGIQGDYFLGFGRGEDSIERYVASLSGIDLVHRPGQMWSYSNTAFVVAGRLAEVVSGLSYHRLMQERICRPLGLSSMTIRTEDMVARRCAVGHVPGPGGRPMVPPTVVMEYAQAPAGSLTVSTAAQLVRFAQMHLNDGAGPDGTGILSAESVRAMQQPQAPVPDISSVPTNMGLGWLLSEWDGHRSIGHNGGTIGQLSFMHALPDDGVVVVLLTNSMTGGLLWRDLARWIFDELVGVHVPDPPKPADPEPRLELAGYAGTYERLGFRHHVSVEDGHLVLRTETTDELPPELQSPPTPPLRLRPIDHQRFVIKTGGIDTVVLFLEFRRGRPGYLFLGRAARRTSSRPAGGGKSGAGRASGRASAARKSSARAMEGRTASVRKEAARKSATRSAAARKSGTRSAAAGKSAARKSAGSRGRAR